MKTKIINISKIYSWNPSSNSLDIKNNQEILIDNGKIHCIANKIKSNYEKLIDAKGCVVTPGFIDSHTHTVFVGNRANEFIERSKGVSYKNIALNGGGIISSIKSFRNATYKEIYNNTLMHLNQFQKLGSTSIEVKSGYGLTFKDEIKALQIIKEINSNIALDLYPTFLGAHDIPKEYKNNKSKYINILCNEMIPYIAENNLAKFCDVFCEEGYYNYDDSKKILKCAKEYGLIPRIHADEFVNSKASKLASEIEAISADHLMAISESGIDALSDSNVIATLLPGTSFFLNKGIYADGRKLIDNGCEVSLASDFNPGTCTIQSLSMIMFLAIQKCGMTLEESFLGITYNAAKSLGVDKKYGLIKEEYYGDLLFWNIEDINEIPYWFDSSSRIKKILKKGIEINLK